MDKVQDAAPCAEQSVYVDDISQVSQGTADQVVDALVRGGIGFSQATVGLHLKVFP